MGHVRWLCEGEVEKPGRIRVLQEVGRFYALTFVLSWAGWMPALLRQWRVPGFESALWLGLTALGAAGPAIAAWIVDRRTFESFRIAVGWRWLLAAVLIPAALLLTTNGLSWALLGSHPRSAGRGWQIVWITAMAVGANIWEEVGWRAYALRRLEDIMQSWMAASIVGVFWAAWHVPLFLSKWSGMTQIPFGWWALRIMATSVIMAWLYNRTGGSLWAVTVFHVGSNVWAAWTGVWSHWIEAIVVWMVAAVLLSRTGGWLGRTPYSRVRFPAAAGVSGVYHYQSACFRKRDFRGTPATASGGIDWPNARVPH